MFFILKLVLIILLNKTYAYIMQDIETILLPACYPTDAKEIPLTLKVFGQLIQLNLHRNDRIVSSENKIWQYYVKGASEKLPQLKASDPCLYIHKNHVSSAIINFCDEHGLHTIFLCVVDNDKEQLRNVILAYVNQIQTVFHHPSLGIPIDISLVKLEIMYMQPSNLPVFDGDYTKLLTSFSNYMNTRNIPDGIDPLHWDIALYVTGIDIYLEQFQQMYFSTEEVASFDNVCNKTHLCAVAEFSAGFAKITSGFAASNTAAYEIGHV